jgi:hypothetical protein
MRRINFFPLLFIFFVFATKGFSQTDSTHAIPKLPVDSSFHFPLILKTTPLTLIDIFNGTSANIIAESFLVKQFSVSMELGAYYWLAGYGMKHLHGWRTGMEFRYYFNENPNYDYFFGLRYFYKQVGFSITDSIQLNAVSYTKNHLVHKEVNVVDLVFGTRQFNPGKKYVTEFYFGIGVRFKNTTCFDLTQNELDHRFYGDSFVFPILMENGQYVHLDFLFGVKVGIGIRKGQ